MPPSDLRHFIAALEERSELSRILVPADPVLEIAAITDRVCKQDRGGAALLFQSPHGSRFPVATNLFGSVRRLCLALGIDSLANLTEQMTQLLNLIDAPDPSRLDHQIGAMTAFSRFTPRLSNELDLELVGMDRPDLRQFPFLHSWPGDGGAEGYPRYITLPLVCTRHAERESRNCGMYGAQLRGPAELALRWKPGRGAARHLESYHRRGEPLPVAIALGGPPVALFSAMMPLPGELDEFTFAGFLTGTPLETVSCRSVPLRVPAGCELVIEGFVHPGETVLEGPFGNHTGYYAPAAQVALMRVSAISHRPDALIPATVVGAPPMEDCWMALAWERILEAFLRRLFPGVRSLSFPLEWIFHQSAVISLENPSPPMVRETAARLWATPWFKAARLLIFVDAGVAAHEPRLVAWRAMNCCDPARDVFMDGENRRMALDATGARTFRPMVTQDDEIIRRVAARWKEYGLP